MRDWDVATGSQTVKTLAELVHCLIKRYDIRGRRIGLDVMTRPHDVSLRVSEDPDVLRHLPPHILRRSKRKRLPIVDAPMKDQRSSAISNETFAVHRPAPPLHRVQNVDTRIDELGDEGRMAPSS